MKLESLFLMWNCNYLRMQRLHKVCACFIQGLSHVFAKIPSGHLHCTFIFQPSLSHISGISYVTNLSQIANESQKISEKCQANLKHFSDISPTNFRHIICISPTYFRHISDIYLANHRKMSDKSQANLR